MLARKPLQVPAGEGFAPTCYADPSGRHNLILLAAGKRYLDGHAVFIADRSGDVTFAGEVFGQLDAAWPDLKLFSSHQLDLAMAAERDHVLAAWSRVPVGHSSG